ncbi:MAG: CD225/dispanin family protein [Pirellulales bacterium]
MSTDPNNPYASPRPMNEIGLGPRSDQGEKPKSYLLPSILATFLCCLPIGVVGIVYAVQVDLAWNARNREGATYASDQARRWCLSSFWLGLIVNGMILGASAFGR